jgi:hypothetical protein
MLIRRIASFFAALSAIGLVLSVVSHLSALMGGSGPLGDKSWYLHLGIFVVWLPAVIAVNRLTREVPQKDSWKVIFRSCPPWMKYMTYSFFGYALLNFVIFMVNGSPSSGTGLMSPADVRGFSGHWMAFYSAALSVLYAAATGQTELLRRCLNGHLVGPLAKYCDQCGMMIPTDQSNLTTRSG